MGEAGILAAEDISAWAGISADVADSTALVADTAGTADDIAALADGTGHNCYLGDRSTEADNNLAADSSVLGKS